MKNRLLQGFSIVEIAMVTVIAGVVIVVISNSLNKTRTNAKDTRALYDTESAKFTGVMAGGDAAFPVDVPIPTGIQKSCKDILTITPSSASGEYTIDPDGTGTGAGSFKVYCDMDTAHGGGGWTLVAAQYEDSPVTDWNLGINEATFSAPTAAMLDSCGNASDGTGSAAGNGCNLANSQGFALSSLQLPDNRTQVAFGKGSDATYTGYSTYLYITGNIGNGGCSGTAVTNIKDSTNWWIYRNTANAPQWQFDLDPGMSNCAGALIFPNSLVYDKSDNAVGGLKWVFSGVPTSIYSPLPKSRGHYMSSNTANIEAYGNTDSSYAWTVWVK